MVFIRRLRRHDHTAPDNERTENIGEGFDGVGDKRVGMTDHAGGQLRAGQYGVRRQPEEGGAQAALEAGQGHDADF